jgi:hypothetical protein
MNRCDGPVLMNRLLFLFSLTSLSLAGCRSSSAPAPVGSTEPQIMEWAGQQGGGETAGSRVLRTTDEWTAFWKQVERTPPRPLDVTKEMAVVVSLGEKRTGGFSAEILNTSVEAGKLTIDYRETAPEPGGMVTQALAYPWYVKVVPRVELPTTIRKVDRRGPSRAEK